MPCALPCGEAVSAPHLSIVIPAYNEQARIGASLDKIARFLEGQPYGWEVVVVDDGSTDRTAAIVNERGAGNVRIRLESQPHAGKGWAVRHGMLAASGELRMLCDADLAMPIDFLPRFLEKMSEGFDVVIGSREVSGARRFDEPPARHWIGRAFNWCVRMLAVRRFQDTQCGFKCFTAGAARSLFTIQRTKGFGFDVEILFLALRQGLQVAEIPIDWYHQPHSKVRPMVDAFTMLRDA
ncbi:MAG: glycosyltransferase family 2 protein, partial [SAR202 cluster bacterium]|nr:glycosyltransferase family 2 protein [SAR202 cluster bacterium]